MSVFQALSKVKLSLLWHTKTIDNERKEKETKRKSGYNLFALSHSLWILSVTAELNSAIFRGFFLE